MHPPWAQSDFPDMRGWNIGICGQAQLWIPRAARGLGAGGEGILEACLGERLPGRLPAPLVLVPRFYLPDYFGPQPRHFPLLIVFPAILKPLITHC